MSENPGIPYLLETPAEKEAREQTDEKRRENAHRRLQLWFNGVLALFAIVTAGAVIYQGCVMRDQLSEMRGTSDLTYHLALNAGLQSTAANRAAGAAEQFSLSAESINRETRTAVNQIRRMADSAKKSSDAAENSLRLQLRPWIGVFGAITINPIQEEVVLFGHIPTRTKHVTVEIPTKNFGSLPGLHTNVEISLVISKMSRDKDTLAIESAYTVSCMRAEVDMFETLDAGFYFTGPRENREPVTLTHSGKGIVEFPGEVAAHPAQFGVAAFSSDELNRPFFVVGCVGYTDGADKETPARFLHSNFCYPSSTPLAGIKSPLIVNELCGISQTAE